MKAATAPLVLLLVSGTHELRAIAAGCNLDEGRRAAVAPGVRFPDECFTQTGWAASTNLVDLCADAGSD